MEENTSKVYVGPSAALLSGQLAAANGAGSALFVINLCASMAPVPLAGKSLPGLDSYRLYQVSRVEDGRTRYRLRLGFFPSEADAEQVLSSVREKYPTAFAACLCDEDRRFARGYLPDTSLSDTQIKKRTVALLVDSPPKAPAAPASSAQPVAVTQSKAAVAAVTPSVAAKAATPPAAAKSAAPAPVAVKPTPAPVAAQPAEHKVAISSPAAAPPVAKQSQPAAKSPIDQATEIELSWEPELAAKIKAQAAARSADAPQAHAAAAPVSDANEIELSWDPPSLSVAPGEHTAAAPVTIPAVFATEPVIKARPEAKSDAKASAPAAKPAADKEPTVRTKAPIAIELTLAAERAAAPQPAQNTPATPFHVAKGVDIPAVSFSLAAEEQAPAVAAKAPVVAATPAKKEPLASKPAPKAAAKEPAKREPATPAASKVAAAPAAPVASKQSAAPSTAPVASKPAAAAPVAAPQVQAPAANTPPVRRIGQPPAIAASASVPELDSTQTIRALTSDELNDAAQEKWFAIQLAVSEQPVNLDAMPHLDIFEAYRLYSVASAGSGKIVHSLRLGFFREAVSADAVGGYLKTFFPNPSVLRISTAEQLRFKDPPAPKATAEAKNESKVIDLSDARQRAAKPVVPTVTMEVATPRPVSDRSPTGTHKISASGSHKLSATGVHKLNASGIHKLDATGSHKLNSSGAHKLNGTGTHKALKSAAKSGGPATRQSAPGKSSKTSNSGKYRAVAKKSLTDQLLDEAREVTLSESGIRKLPQNNSLLSRLVDKLKK